MRNVIFCSLIVIASTGLVQAQNDAQLVWRGQIDGPTRFRIAGDRLEVEENGVRRSSSAPDYRFTNALPAAPQDVQVLVRQGRAEARVVDQPRANNNFTALVEVTPRRRTGEPVALEFFWDQNGRRDWSQNGQRGDGSYRGRGRMNRNRGSGSLSWSGRVDQEATIEIRNRQAVSTTRRGQPVYGEAAQFSGAMPASDILVRLDDSRGRGNIRLVQQPNAENGHTARVRIVDQQNGAGDYSFVLSWDDQHGYGQGSQQPIASRLPQNQNLGYGQMRWSGRVDGRIRVTVQGDRAFVTQISGAAVQGERADFNGGRLDNRSVGQVSVRKVHGRGDVQVMEQPSPQNGYRMVFEINDSDGGADDYEVDVTW